MSDVRSYRYMQRVHALGHMHQRSHNNPIVLGAPIPVGTRGLAYRSALCGQIAYCCEDPDSPYEYIDQFGPIPFVSWRKSGMVTCKSCQKALSK